MADNNLSNKAQMIRDFIVEVLKQDLPNADLSENSPFSDMFISPHIRLMEPVLEYIDRISMQQSLDNARLLTPEEMDEVGRRYFKERDNGERSSGYVTMIFSDIPANGTLVVPAGEIILSKQGYEFTVDYTHSFSENRLFDYYNPATFEYKVPVFCRSVLTGSRFNLEPGEINRTDRAIPNLKGVVNESSFAGGEDSETNQEFANRIKEEAFGANMGIERGYKQFFNSFKDVKDTVLAGKGHPLMQRDLIEIVKNRDEEGNIETEKIHWGNMIDTYIRGETLEEYKEFLEVEKDEETGEFYISLSMKPLYDIIDVKIYDNQSQISDPNMDDSILYTSEYVLDRKEDDDWGTVNEEARLIIRDGRTTENSVIRVRYRYNGLISQIHERMYVEGERPPTADVRLIEAPSKYVFGSLVLRMSSPLGLRDKDKNTIRQRSSGFINELEMGEEIQFSELYDSISSVSGTEEALVDYFNLPSYFMTFANKRSLLYDSLGADKKEFIDGLKNQYFYIGEIINKFKLDVTMYDFFDILHVLTSDNNYESSKSVLSKRNHEWNTLVTNFTSVREMITRNELLKRITPSRIPLEEQEYWRMGNLYLYEDTKYREDDWESNILLLRNLASINEGDSDLTPMYELAVYCALVLYVNTASDIKSEGTKPLFDFLASISKYTPIHSQLYI